MTSSLDRGFDREQVHRPCSNLFLQDGNGSGIGGVREHRDEGTSRRISFVDHERWHPFVDVQRGDFEAILPRKKIRIK